MSVFSRDDKWASFGSDEQYTEDRAAAWLFEIIPQGIDVENKFLRASSFFFY